tara:strand:- start:2718 stop:3653 length:936 start_codon:yes stop_codon:yes gene_type:complete
MNKHKQSNIVVKDPTVGYCLDLWYHGWIQGRMITSEPSQNRYMALINNLKEYFNDMQVSQVDIKASQEYIKLRKNGLLGTSKAADGTIRLELQRLRACFRFMVERVEPRKQRLRADQIPYVDLPPESLPRQRFLNEDEVNLIREVCPNLVLSGQGRVPSNRLSRVGRFAMIALETAARKSAIQELKWDQVDLEANKINFNPHGRAQTIKRRPIVSISNILKPVLERAKEEALNGYVLDKPTNIADQITWLGKELSIPGLHPHVFRHTWATRAVSRGVSLAKVAMFLGDTEKTVEKTYKHLAPDYLSDVHDS